MPVPLPILVRFEDVDDGDAEYFFSGSNKYSWVPHLKRYRIVRLAALETHALCPMRRIQKLRCIWCTCLFKRSPDGGDVHKGSQPMTPRILACMEQGKLRL